MPQRGRQRHKTSVLLFIQGKSRGLPCDNRLSTCMVLNVEMRHSTLALRLPPQPMFVVLQTYTTYVMDHIVRTIFRSPYILGSAQMSGFTDNTKR